MVNYVYITLDTTPPSNPNIKIEGNATHTTGQLVNLTVGTGDPVTNNYQMKIWGDVDPTHNTNVKGTEELSSWIPYSANPQVKLLTGDGNKIVNVKIRDHVHNVSSLASDSIILDTKIPTVTTTSRDVDTISKNPGKDLFHFSFSTDKDIQEYKVKLVGVEHATHNTGSDILTAHGSVNTGGVVSIPKGQMTTITIKFMDLEAAGATNEEDDKIIKVFVKDLLGNWCA